MHLAAYTLLACWVFWNLYVYSMGLYRAKLQGRLVGLPLVLASPLILLTFVLDALLQFTVASLAFWRLPEGVGFAPRSFIKFGRTITVPWWPVGDWFVTHRLRRYIAAGPALGWRFRMAEVICRRLTDPFDPTGAHCDSEPPKLAEAHK